MPEIRYTKDHEYIRVEGDHGVVGISDHAQEQLGDVVFVEVPAIGKAFKEGDPAAVVESVKAASEVFAPVVGRGHGGQRARSSDAGPGQRGRAGARAGCFASRSPTRASSTSLMDEAAYAEFLKTMA